MNLLSIIHSFIELESVDSTNNYAMAQAHAGTASQGDLFFAHDQWAGKGQRGKTWSSGKGENIILSLVLEPVFLAITQQFSLSIAVALAAHDLFNRYAGQEASSIKWPNDIYWRDRKAGGILIENSFKGDQWAFAIVGIGMNINQVQFPETAKNPVSLKQITGKTFDPVSLAKELGECVGERYEQLRTEGAASLPAGPTALMRGPTALLAEYHERLYKLGQRVRLKKDNAVFETQVAGVAGTGELITRDVFERRFRVGEVEWVIGD
jgi:BirA family transcriptional regulator, biotin operon repressor / biotin---[acetyl-CoA-carboxylase] ligase